MLGATKGGPTRSSQWWGPSLGSCGGRSVLSDIEFADFVAARSRALLRTAYALTGDYQRAEDLTGSLYLGNRASYGDYSEVLLRTTGAAPCKLSGPVTIRYFLR